ncbi:MAG: NTP transferase domain-containing protein, partial [Gemmatimonadota bacterium]|nr:NTP transferase domain-containing protein [Gemmatimonadota bacterium]
CTRRSRRGRGGRRIVKGPGRGGEGRRSSGHPPRVVGVVPAAGRARRLGSPAGSKELLPVYPDPRRPGRTLPVCYRLFDAFREASIPEAVVVLRTGKGDLRSRLEAGPPRALEVEILELDDSPSSAFTIATGTRRAGDATVALGFPDVLWEGARAFSRLLEALDDPRADAVLGLFPQAPDYPTHTVELGEAGRVLGFSGPGGVTGDRPAWTLAVWRPTVSRWIERAVEARYGAGARADAGAGELGMTEVFRGAIAAGLRFRGLEVSPAPFLDVGDPERLAEARRRAEVARRD